MHAVRQERLPRALLRPFRDRENMKDPQGANYYCYYYYYYY